MTGEPPTGLPTHGVTAVRVRCQDEPPEHAAVDVALEEAGWDHHAVEDLDALQDTVRRTRAGVVVRLPAVEQLLDPHEPRTMWRRARQLLRAVMTVRLHGAAIVYSVAEATPATDLHRYVSASVAALANVVTVPVETARWRGAALTDPARVRVVPPANLVGRYGPRLQRHEARQRLAVRPDATVLLSLGDLQATSNPEPLIDAFDMADLPGAQLVIVGPPAGGDAALRRLEDRMAGLGRPRARLVAAPVPHELISTWLGAADVAVLVAERALVPRPVLLALSYGLPVVAPDAGAVSEYVWHGRNGFLYSPGDTTSLAFALRRAVDALPADPDTVMRSVELLSPAAVAAELTAVFLRALVGRWERPTDAGPHQAGV